MNINSKLTIITYNCLSFIDKYFLYILIFVGVYYLILSLSMFFIYKKVGKKSINALIPIYNIISFLNFADLPAYMVILFIVPYVNILGIIFGFLILNPRIVRSLNRSVIAELGSIFLPFVTFPVVACRKNLVYQKISEQSAKVKVEEPVVKKDDIDLPEVEVKIPEIDVPVAMSMDSFNDEMNNAKVEEVVEDKIEDGVDALTFDYNSMYNNIKEEKEDESLNIPTEPIEIEENDGVSLNELENISGDNSVLDIPVAPIEELPKVEESIEVEPITEEIPQVDNSVLDIPVAPVDELPKVEEPIEEKDDMNIPDVDVEIPKAEDTDAISMDAFNNEIDSAPVETIEEDKKEDGVDALTFDYNAMYNNIAEEKEDEVLDIPVAPVDELPKVEEPIEVEPITEEIPQVDNSVLDISVAPIDELPKVEEPIEVEPITEDIPQVDNSVLDIPVAPIEELPKAEEPIEVEPITEDIPQVDNSVLDIPVAPVDELPKVEESIEVEPITEEIPQVDNSVLDIPVAPVDELPKVEEPIEVEPITEEIPQVDNSVLDISVAPIDELPKVEEPIEVEPITEDIPQVDNSVLDIPVAPIDELPKVEEPIEVEPITEEIPQVEDTTIEEIPVVPVEDTNSTDMVQSIVEDPMEDIQSMTPPIKPVDDDKPDLPSVDGYTFDYNAIYNVDANKLEEDAEATNDKSEDDILSSFIADAPSFDIPEEEPEEEYVEEYEEIPEVSKEDLVSIDIAEPDVLPVGKRRVKKEAPEKPNVTQANQVTNQPNFIGAQGVVRLQVIPQVIPTMQVINPQQPIQRPMQGGVRSQQARPSMGGARPQPNGQRPMQGRPQGTQQARPGMGGVRPQPNGQRPMQGRPQGTQQARPSMGGVRPQPNGQRSQQGRPLPMNAAGFNPTNGPLLRANENTRAQQAAVQPRAVGKFIKDTQEEYSFQKKEVPRVQQPTNPALRANPMSIFGASNNALRPTSGESLRNGGRANVCPKCGFAIKPGQPMCVMCGYRLR